MYQILTGLALVWVGLVAVITSVVSRSARLDREWRRKRGLPGMIDPIRHQKT